MTIEAVHIADADHKVAATARALYFARQNILFVVGAAVFFAIVLAAILAPLIAPYDPTAINFADKLNAPGV